MRCRTDTAVGVEDVDGRCAAAGPKDGLERTNSLWLCGVSCVRIGILGPRSSAAAWSISIATVTVMGGTGRVLQCEVCTMSVLSDLCAVLGARVLVDRVKRIRGTVQSIYSALSCIRSLIAHCGGIGSVWYGSRLGTHVARGVKVYIEVERSASGCFYE